MAKQFRVSVVARLHMGVRRQDVESIMTPALAKQGLTTADKLCWISFPSEDGEKRYVKFSALVPLDQLDDAWNLRASRQFSDAGFGDVAWKITPVEDNDQYGEDTTCSIPQDLFLELNASEDNRVVEKPGAPPAPFGSERFWECFDEVGQCPIDFDNGEGDTAASHHSPQTVAGSNGLSIMCASCGKMRDAQGAWITIEFSQVDQPAGGVSHGICPECAKKLYPDLYPD